MSPCLFSFLTKRASPVFLLVRWCGACFKRAHDASPLCLQGAFIYLPLYLSGNLPMFCDGPQYPQQAFCVDVHSLFSKFQKLPIGVMKTWNSCYCDNLLPGFSSKKENPADKRLLWCSIQQCVDHINKDM